MNNKEYLTLISALLEKASRELKSKEYEDLLGELEVIIEDLY